MTGVVAFYWLLSSNPFVKPLTDPTAHPPLLAKPILITGVAGFIGVNLAQRFLAQGRPVLGLDNLCRGSLANLKAILEHPLFTFKEVHLHDLSAFTKAVSDYMNQYPQTHLDEVWHLAANSDIPAGIDDPAIDLRDTFMTTFNTLVVMKQMHISTLAFASSSAVYGDFGEQVLTEDLGPLLPISNYGAMKLASEAIISAAVEGDIKRAYLFRFPNVIGVPATHGVIFDFIHKLKATPNTLVVLGDGTQQKSYLHVNDLIDAMIFIVEHAGERLNYFNIGAGDTGITVAQIAQIVTAAVAPSAKIEFGIGNKGWVGDVPRFTYAIDKLRALGWQPKCDSAQAVKLAVGQIANQLGVRSWFA